MNRLNIHTLWLTQSCKAHAEQDEVRNFRPKVLALCGPSGCAKSTLVEVLCKELDIDVVVWHDEMWEAEASSSPSRQEEDVDRKALPRVRFV
jgi:ABC-type phosphate transport system ATPase subunit